MKNVSYSSDKTLSGARRHNPNTLKVYILHWTNCNFMQGNLCRKRGYLTRTYIPMILSASMSVCS